MSSNILHKASGADIHYISAVLQYLFRHEISTKKHRKSKHKLTDNKNPHS